MTNTASRIGNFVLGRLRSLRQSLLRTDLIVLFLVAIAVRVTLLAISLHQGGIENLEKAVPDSGTYLNMAAALLANSSDFEWAFFIFGPGYACFLALGQILFLGSHLAIILTQIVLSSLTALMVFLLSNRLTQSYAVSITAGYLFALSYTGISLSLMFMPETLYMFVFMLSFILYLSALHEKQLGLFVASGILAAYGIFVKQTGLLWFVPLLAVAVITYARDLRHGSWRNKLKLMKGPLIAITIIMMAVFAWALRINSIHGVFTYSYASAGGPFNVAATAMEKYEGKSYREISADWYNEYRQEVGNNDLSQEQMFLYARRKTTEIILSHPLDYIEAHLMLTWENINRPNYLPRFIFPKSKLLMVEWDTAVRSYNLHFINFFICLAGMLALLVRKNYRALAILLIVYVYFALLVGFTKHQGSRLFIPGQLAAVIFLSAAFSTAAGGLKWSARRIFAGLANLTGVLRRGRDTAA